MHLESSLAEQSECMMTTAHSENRCPGTFHTESLLICCCSSCCWACGQETVTPKQREELQIKFAIAREILSKWICVEQQ